MYHITDHVLFFHVYHSSWSMPHHRVVIFKRMSLMMGIIYLFRGVCMISTVFPLANHHYHCEPQVSVCVNSHHEAISSILSNLFIILLNICYCFKQYSWTFYFIYLSYHDVFQPCLILTLWFLFTLQIPNNTTLPVGEFVSIIASRVGYMLLGFGLSINGRHSYCGDYLFSGHTVILTLGQFMIF